TVQVEVPSLLLYPRPMPHRFSTDPQQGADMACANLHFEGGRLNPISAALPDFICLPLAELYGGKAALELLFEEAFEQRC
ncbi:cupin domain-containing protein, partial [Klebsiella pneumoniae]|nr:cupin domain-containing protein [Klebsiella pneumoniae]